MLPSSSFEAGLLNDIIGRCYFRGLVDACGLVKERRPGLVDGGRVTESRKILHHSKHSNTSYLEATTSAEIQKHKSTHRGCFVGEDIASYEMYG